MISRIPHESIRGNVDQSSVLIQHMESEDIKCRIGVPDVEYMELTNDFAPFRRHVMYPDIRGISDAQIEHAMRPVEDIVDIFIIEGRRPVDRSSSMVFKDLVQTLDCGCIQRRVFFNTIDIMKDGIDDLFRVHAFFISFFEHPFKDSGQECPISETGFNDLHGKGRRAFESRFIQHKVNDPVRRHVLSFGFLFCESFTVCGCHNVFLLECPSTGLPIHVIRRLFSFAYSIIMVL